MIIGSQLPLLPFVLLGRKWIVSRQRLSSCDCAWLGQQVGRMTRLRPGRRGWRVRGLGLGRMRRLCFRQFLVSLVLLGWWGSERVETDGKGNTEVWLLFYVLN